MTPPSSALYQAALAASRNGFYVSFALPASLILLGAFLRLYHFTTPDLWIDEYGTWWVVAPRAWSEVAQRALQVQGQSPFYYFFVKLSSDLLGLSPLAFRLPSLLFGIGIPGLAYLVGLKLFQDRHAALLALAAFAVNERMIFYSQEARPYALALFCTLLSFLFYLSLLNAEKLSARIGYLLATGGAYYAHFLFGFIVVIQLLHLLARSDRARSHSRAWTLTFLLLALISLPGVPQLLGLFARRESLNWLPPPGAFAPLELVVQFLDPWIFSATAFSVLAIGSTAARRDQLPDQAHGGLILSWLLLPVVFFGVVSQLSGISLLYSRYLLLVAPAAIFAVAWLMALVPQTQPQKWIPLVTFLTVTFLWNLLPPVPVSGTFCRWLNQGWESAAQELETSARPEDLILYRTGFVEADLLRLPNPDPMMVSFIEWPLTANLSSPRRYQLTGLPFRENAQTATYISSLVDRARQRDRVWVIGLEPLITNVAHALMRGAEFKVRKRIRYGSVEVVLLEQTRKRPHRTQ